MYLMRKFVAFFRCSLDKPLCDFVHFENEARIGFAAALLFAKSIGNYLIFRILVLRNLFEEKNK